ncbi:MAG: diguanylate cyclase [Synechococcus sp.]
MGLRRRLFASQIAGLLIVAAGFSAGRVLRWQGLPATVKATLSVAAAGSAEREGQIATLLARLQQAERVELALGLAGLGLGAAISLLGTQRILAPLRQLDRRLTRLSSCAADAAEAPLALAAQAPAEVKSLTASYEALLDRVRILIARVEDHNLSDSLTLLGNSRQFQQQLAVECRRMQRNDQPLSLLLVDLDHFRALNDRFGHPEGDRTLVRVAAAIRAEGRRSADLSCRIGGGEFALLLPGNDQNQALTVAHRIIEAIDALAIPNPDSHTAPQLTVTIGVGTSLASEETAPAALYAAADRALVEARRNGRRHGVGCAPDEGAQLRNSRE